jgi:3-deoxy-D-manno-octulosonic acid kinase
MSDALPPGYVSMREGGATCVMRADIASGVREALRAGGSLYDWAAHARDARVMHGRAPVYAATLPDSDVRVVVRHAWHGGLFAPLTGDRFLAPTRAPHELATSLRLAAAGVATPEMVAYAIYPAGPLLRTSDVATRELSPSRDLAAALAEHDAVSRSAALHATAELLRALQRAGARHPDLNLKNVLLLSNVASNGSSSAALTAYVLDVDRVILGDPADMRITSANLERLTRSARKWRSLHALPVSDAELADLASAARLRSA